MIRQSSGSRDRYTVGIERSTSGRAVKTYNSHVLAEFEKARAMERALAGTPFHVPRALHCDPDLGRIEFEFWDDSVLFQEILEQAYHSCRFRRAMRLNEAAARLLGLLHRGLVVPGARNWQPPAFLSKRALSSGHQLLTNENVYLHCDYSPVNLLVNRDDQMAVIDASPNAYFTNFPCLVGHPFVDVASYTCKLIWPYRLRSHSRAWRKLAAVMRRRFIATYEHVRGGTVDDRLLRIFESAVVRSFVEWKTSSRLLRFTALSLERTGLHRRS